MKRPQTRASAIVMPVLGSPLIKPGSVRKPLIASGPNAPRPRNLSANDGKPRKTPYDKRELAKFKAILLRKRAELVGDVSTMETEALKGNSGSLSHVPQHMAEQGSDVYGQSLSLDLAAADRRLIKEIDDALKRIDAGTYGVCELTGKPIRAERLEELPWARYSIEAARELERRSTMP
jgi:DnaK suppressor protein